MVKTSPLYITLQFIEFYILSGTMRQVYFTGAGRHSKTQAYCQNLLDDSSGYIQLFKIQTIKFVDGAKMGRK